MKGLKRFLGIVYKHPVYGNDQAIRAFLSQPSFKVPKAPSRQDALTLQIPTADALIRASQPEELILTQKCQLDAQKMTLLLHHLQDHIRTIRKQYLGNQSKKTIILILSFRTSRYSYGFG